MTTISYIVTINILLLILFSTFLYSKYLILLNIFLFKFNSSLRLSINNYNVEIFHQTLAHCARMGQMMACDAFISNTHTEIALECVLCFMPCWSDVVSCVFIKKNQWSVCGFLFCLFFVWVLSINIHIIIITSSLIGIIFTYTFTIHRKYECFDQILFRIYHSKYELFIIFATEILQLCRNVFMYELIP